MDALAKHVEKDDSPKWGLIDSMGRRQKTIIINVSGHVDNDDRHRPDSGPCL
jgi:hypothetical protein